MRYKLTATVSSVRLDQKDSPPLWISEDPDDDRIIVISTRISAFKLYKEEVGILIDALNKVAE